MVGTRKIDSGSIGSATRRSMSTNTPISTSPPIRKPVTVASNAVLASRVIAHSTPNRPSPRVIMPGKSRRRRERSALSCSTRVATASAATPTGTLIQKIHRQEI